MTGQPGQPPRDPRVLDLDRPGIASGGVVLAEPIPIASPAEMINARLGGGWRIVHSEFIDTTLNPAEEYRAHLSVEEYRAHLSVHTDGANWACAGLSEMRWFRSHGATVEFQQAQRWERMSPAGRVHLLRRTLTEKTILGTDLFNLIENIHGGYVSTMVGFGFTAAVRRDLIARLVSGRFDTAGLDEEMLASLPTLWALADHPENNTTTY